MTNLASAPASARVLAAWLAVLLFLTIGAPAMATEQPDYQVLKQYDDFEIRRYPPYLVAETEVSGDFESVGGQAFRILAGYISGDNRRRQEIAMTAPVQQSAAAGERIAMTAPVAQAPVQGGKGRYLFSFIMPAGYSLDSLPLPNDPRIRLRQVEGRTLAARGYTGTWSQERYQRNENALLDALRKAGLRPMGVPVFARYNAPFTPWFLRRNEVLVEVQWEGPGH